MCVCVCVCVYCVEWHTHTHTHTLLVSDSAHWWLSHAAVSNDTLHLSLSLCHAQLTRYYSSRSLVLRLVTSTIPMRLDVVSKSNHSCNQALVWYIAGGACRAVSGYTSHHKCLAFILHLIWNLCLCVTRGGEPARCMWLRARAAGRYVGWVVSTE